MALEHEVEIVSAPAGAMAEEIHPIRPQRVKARRGVELLCIMETNELEWYDFDEVDVSGWRFQWNDLYSMGHLY